MKSLNKKFNEILKQTEGLAIKLLGETHSDPKVFPETQGVYLIHDKSGKIIYVGKGKKLRRRIKSDHISGDKDGSTSTFRITIHEKYKIPFGQEMREWVISNCLFSYVEIKDPDITSLVEALLIATLRKNKTELLNK